MLKVNNKLQLMFLTKKGVVTIKWIDNKDVSFLTNAPNSAVMASVNQTKFDGTKTEVLSQKLSKRYHGRSALFRSNIYIKNREKICKIVQPYHYFLDDLDIVNIYIMWQMNKRNRCLHQLPFGIALAHQVIDEYSLR